MQLPNGLLVPKADESLGQYLRRLRLQRGLSQAEVVGLAGIHLQSLGKIERGRTLKLNQKTARGLAYALNIPSEYLEAVGKGVAVDVPSALKFCPSCWTVGMTPESMWLDLRAKYCFLCGIELRHRCASCQEPITSLKHRFCPSCGTSYQSPLPKKV
jgi:DNA-binding XRE family transcriptional regulator